MKHNISFLTLLYGDTSGGSRVLTNLANEFVSRGHSVSIVCMSSKPPNANTFNLNAAIRVIYLDKFKAREDCSNLLNIVFNRIKTAFSVIRYYKNKKEPMIISCIGPSANLIVSFLNTNKNLKTVGCDHSSFEITHKGLSGRIRKWRYAYLSAIVSLTHEDVKNICTFNKNVWVIPNSVSFLPSNVAMLQNKIILVVARLDTMKGLDMLLDILEEISDRIHGWKCRIAGEGPLRSWMENRISNSEKLKNMVELLGIVSNMSKEYINASILVLTSRGEGLPMVLIEAQAFGLPVVSFDCKTGPAEIITDSKDGFLIPSFDTNLMGERIVNLCDDYHLRLQFGSCARNNAKRFLPENIVAKWEKLFDSLQKL